MLTIEAKLTYDKKSMLSYTGLRQYYGLVTNNTTSGNLTNGDFYMNQAIRRIVGARDWPFMESQDTSQTTGTLVQYYNVPGDYGKDIDVTVTVGSILYHVREVPSREKWDRMNYALSVTSNIPQWCFFYNGQVGFWPKPSQSGNTITFNYKKAVRDLNFADYSTGAVLTLTSGTTTVLGTSTGWTTAMAGMSIRATFDGLGNRGDGNWYKIASVTGTSTLILSAPYQGTNVTSGTAPYLIGQVPVIPENYQVMPAYYAAAEYWRVNGNNIAKAQEFERLYNDMLAQMQKDYGEKSANPMIDRGIGEVPTLNPNLTIFM